MVTNIFYHIILVYILNFYHLVLKGTGESMQNKLYSGMQIMTAKTTIIWTLYVNVVLNGVIFRQILYNIAPYALLSTCQNFSQILL